MKELKGTKTERNLMEAFAGESQARNKYTFFASKARKEGYEQIAALFEETAQNEKEHAKMWSADKVSVHFHICQYRGWTMHLTTNPACCRFHKRTAVQAGHLPSWQIRGRR